MAAKSPATRDSQTQVYNYRTEMGVFEWGGCIPDGDNAAIPDNRPRMLVNARHSAGSIVPRGGQRTIRSSALQAADAKVRGMFDFQVGTPYSLYMLAVGCPTISNTSGRSLNTFDSEQDPEFMPGSYYSDASRLYAGTYSGDLYIGSSANTDIKLRRFNLAYPARGSTTLLVSGFGLDYVVATFPIATYTILYGIKEFDGKLYLAVKKQAAATTDVYTWDGTTLREEILGVSGSISRFETYRDSLILGFNDSTSLRIHTIGDAVGTWATATAADVAMFRGVSYKDTFYFSSRDEFLFSFNGTTITKIPVATTGFPANCLTMGIATFNNILYVTYLETVASPDEIKLGSYDGSSWTAEVKDFGALTATQDALWAGDPERGSMLIGHRQNLIVSTGTSIEVSPGTDATGTYRSITQGVTPGDTFDFFPW